MQSTALPLRSQLARQKELFLQRAAPARVAIMEQATFDLKATGIEARALTVGEPAPDATVRDANGQLVHLRDLWRTGPLVLVFYRGGWCPYCNLSLRAWQEHLGTLKSLGGSLAAISPETPDHGQDTAGQNELGYPVLSDSDLSAARAFGLSFELAPELVDLYRASNIDVARHNGNGLWMLPIPATYVIGQDGHILHAFVEADYRERAEPAEVLANIR